MHHAIHPSFLSLVLAAPLLGGPVINEIMFHPQGEPEDAGKEWIEIHNPDATEVDLGGFRLSKGVDFTIPNPMVLPAGGFLVVAADLAKFKAAYPKFVGAVVGGWTGRLSNTAERIQLDDASGTQVDQVDYADEGDWALRGRGPTVEGWQGHRGWSWFNPADGEGRTFELSNPKFARNSGQAWSVSKVNGGTPGAPNSVLATDIAPTISGARHRPQIPRSTDRIRVSANVTDDNGATVTATLNWRVDGAAKFTQTLMVDKDGDGDVEAEIPPQANLTVVEYYLEASDGANKRTWPAAARTSEPGATAAFAQACNALFQVDNSHDPAKAWAPGAQQIIRVIMTAAEREEYRVIGEDDDNQNRKIDATMHATVITVDGTGTETRHLCGVRNRGFSSRNGPPNNHYVAFASDNPWHGRQAFQLNCQYGYNQVLAATIFARAGIAEQNAVGVQLRFNGRNPGVPGDGVGNYNANITFGAFARIEPMNSDWIQAHYPLDADGNLYRCDDHSPNNVGPNNPDRIEGDLGSGEFRYEGTNPLAYADTYYKRTNDLPANGPDPYNYEDLINLCRVLSAPTDADAPGQPRIAEEEYKAALAKVLDLDQWLTFIAADALVGNQEGGLQSGRADDFGLYRGLVDKRFRLIPHDFDTAFGLGSAQGGAAGGASAGLTRSIFSYAGVAGWDRLFNHPDILPDYYAKVLALMDRVFNRTTLDPVIDEIMTPWGVPAATVTAMKTFVDQRRANVLAEIPRTNTLAITGNMPDVDGLRASNNGTFAFGGTFDVAKVRSITINGQLVPLKGSNYRRQNDTPAGSWTYTANGLIAPGVNRATVTYYAGPKGTGEVLRDFTQDLAHNSGGGTAVASNGGISRNTLHLKSPTRYVPGVPFLVEVEYQDSTGTLEKSAWNRTATLSANNGVTLSPAGGTGPALVKLYNGRGSLLVSTGGGGGGTVGGGNNEILIASGGTKAAPNAAGPAWWYLDVGVDQGNSWRTLTTANDWLSGPLQAGAGDDDERTTLRNVTGATARRTFYFRRVFDVPDPSKVTGLILKAIVDDGALFFLNGVPVKSDNMPANSTFATFAQTSRSAPAESTANTFDISEFLSAVNLKPTGNVLAVEVHNATNSNDLSFDCSLEAVVTKENGNGGGEVKPTDPGNFTLTASADGLNATKPITSLTPTPTKVDKAGALPGSETWSGVINITADVTVPAGAVLTIEPGTQVLVAGTPFGGGGSGGADIIIQGQLQALGTEANPISITCSNPANRWGEITFATGAQASVLRHCLISRACHSPGGGHTGTGPMIRLAGTNLTLEDCLLTDSPGKTMFNSGNANLTIRRCHMARTVMGPELDGSAILIEDSHFTDMLPANRESGAPDDEDCIYIHDSGGRPVNLRHSVFANCGDDVIDLLAGSVTVEDCIIRDGFDKGLSLLNNDITLRRCQIVDNDIGVSAKIQNNSASTPFLVTMQNCTVFSQNHPTNTSDGTFHSVGLHTRNKNNTASANITWNVVNCIIAAEEPVANDFPSVGSTVFGQMNFRYSCFQDLGGTNAANALPEGSENVVGNPLFVDAAGRNFRLQADSPCRDKGDPSATDADGSRSDMGALPFGSGVPVESPSNIVWSLAGSPYLVTQNTTIGGGSTLTIEPGVSVFFSQNARLTVNGRLIARGTKDRRIRMSSPPGVSLTTDVDPIKNGLQTGAPKWGGLRIVDSLAEENIVSYVDFINAQGTSPGAVENWGSVGFIRSWGWADHLTFAGTHLRMCYARNSKMTVTYCDFPDMFLRDAALNRVEIPADFLAAADNSMEPLKVEYPTTDPELAGQTGATGRFPNGLPAGGHWRVYFNEFHGNRGHQDVFDADSGRWNQPGQFVLDCRYNRFNGVTGDEHIDLGGDAYIAHNVFLTGSKDEWTIDNGYANAVSSGDKGAGTTILLARNVFYDLDHAINCKINTATIFEHNTCADFHQDWQYNHTVRQDVRGAAVNLYVPNDNTQAGDGAYMAYNIFFGNVPSADDPQPEPPGGFPRLISWPDVTTTGPKTSIIRIENNFVDPRILDKDLGANHPGGIFAPEWGFGNVQGDPLFVDKSAKDFRLRADSPAKGSAAGGLDFGATVAEWAYILDAPPTRTPSNAATLTIGGPGVVAYKWRLDGGTWSQPIQIGAGGVMPRTGPIIRQAKLELKDLAAGAHKLEVLGQDMAGNWQDDDPARKLEGMSQFGPTTLEWSVEPNLALLLISEVAAATADGVDWVELHNAGASTVDLGGWSLTDQASEPGKFKFAAGTTIPIGGRLRVDSKLTGLTLDRDGDDIALFEGATLRDKIAFGPQPVGYTLGRVGRDWAWTLTLPTPEAANKAAPLAPADGLRISEWLASSKVRFAEDFIELQNTSALPVALTGLRLTDNKVGLPSAFVFGPLSYIGPNAYQTLIADSKPSAGPNHLPFVLDAQQEHIALLDDTKLIHEVYFYPQTTDQSVGLSPTGSPVYFELPTSGLANGTSDPGYANALALLRGLRVTEFMYNAPGGNDFDWVELRNVGSTPLRLNGVRFVEGIEFTFGDLTLAPNQNILVVANAGAFVTRYGAGANVAGVYSGKLDNGGEILTLRLPAPFEANVLRFGYSDGWYAATDGKGRSLELASVNADIDVFGDRDAWIASAADGGSPDGKSATIAPSAYAQWLANNGVIEGSDNDGDGLKTLAEYGLGLNPKLSDPAPTAVSRSADGALTLSFWLPENAAATAGHGREEVRYVVESSPDMLSWSAIATKTTATNWTGSANVTFGQVNQGFILVTVRTENAKFLRLGMRTP